MPRKFFYFALVLSCASLGIALSFDFFSGMLSQANTQTVDSNFQFEIFKVPRGQKSSNPFIPIIEKETDSAPIETPAKQNIEFAEKFAKRKITLKINPSKGSALEIQRVNACKSLIEQTLSLLPEDLTKSLDELELHLNRQNPRGLSSSHEIELRCADIDDSEMVAVFVHELGHIVDLGFLKGGGRISEFQDGSVPIMSGDPSVDFYSLSWQDEKTQKYSAVRSDFVSGYAMSDIFEDFAESFTLYVLHGRDFRMLAQESEVLERKYEFLRDTVFDGQEFSSSIATTPQKRVWDTTLIPYNLDKFFGKQNLIVQNQEPAL